MVLIGTFMVVFNTDEMLIGDLISIVNDNCSHLIGIHEWDYVPVEGCD